MIFPEKSKLFKLRLYQSVNHRYRMFLRNIIHNKNIVESPSLIRYVATILLLYRERNRKNIGVLQSRPRFEAIMYGLLGMAFNINHLGSVYFPHNRRLGVSYQMERDVIEWMKVLIHSKNDSVEGYITSGGTESNLYIMWALRDLLLKSRPQQKSTVIITPLTHYSVLKGARILGLNYTYTPVNKYTWGMDIELLKKTIEKEISKGSTHFQIPITLGYSSTGTSDSIRDIVALLSYLEKKHVSVVFQTWVDASGQGLPFAFLEKNFKPLAHKFVYGFVTDFHKLGDAPIPSGIVLAKNKLRMSIQRSIAYLPEMDMTVSGSRPGFSAMMIWSIIRTKSIQNWKSEFNSAEHIKNTFVEKFLYYFPKKNIIYSKYSLTMAIVVDADFKRLPQELESKYDLFLCSVDLQEKGSKLIHYKIHIMPHMSLRDTTEFLYDILQAQHP